MSVIGQYIKKYRTANGITQEQLGQLVEQVSGMAYEDYIRQNIFEPLGMTHSGFSGEAAENPQWGLTYENLGLCSDLLEHLKGCGDIVSTAGDRDIWMTALQSGRCRSAAVKLRGCCKPQRISCGCRQLHSFRA